MKRSIWISLCVCMELLVFTAAAQYTTQTVNLDAGWNGVYLQLTPTEPACETVFANTPVSHVSLYNSNWSSIQYTESPDEPLDRNPEYLTWNQEATAGAHSLTSLIGDEAYLFYATNNCTMTLTGRPVVPRQAWKPMVSAGSTNTANLIGFAVSSNVTFGTWLEGANFQSINVYEIGGTDESYPTLTPLGAWSGVHSELITPGQAYFIEVDQTSNYCGPVKGFPGGSTGLSFTRSTPWQSISLLNNSGEELDATIQLQPSVANPSTGTTPRLPELYYLDQSWQPLTNSVTKTLLPDETWQVNLRANPDNMTEEGETGGLLVCSDSAGGSFIFPLEEQYSSTTDTSSPWPSGLWVGTASLDMVSAVDTNDVLVAPCPAGATLEYRLILHVDTNQTCRLLQRVVVASSEDSYALYDDISKVPADETALIRISSVALSLTNAVGSATGFGDTLEFNYTLDANDSANPFLHHGHPDHDGLGTDFTTPLPSGDDPFNYIGEIKPESFSISNKVELIWSSDQTAGGTPLWSPSESSSGTINHYIYGLRFVAGTNSGCIATSGHFSLKRICPVGTLSN